MSPATTMLEASKCCSSNCYVLYVPMSERASQNIQGRMQGDWSISWLFPMSEQSANYKDAAALYNIERAWGRRGCMLQIATATVNYKLT